VAFEKQAVANKDQSVSFLNRHAAPVQTVRASKGRRWERKIAVADPDADGTGYYVSRLYSDPLI